MLQRWPPNINQTPDVNSNPDPNNDVCRLCAIYVINKIIMFWENPSLSLSIEHCSITSQSDNVLLYIIMYIIYTDIIFSRNTSNKVATDASTCSWPTPIRARNSAVGLIAMGPSNFPDFSSDCFTLSESKQSNEAVGRTGCLASTTSY